MEKPELTKENVLLLEAVVEGDPVKGVSVLILCFRNADDQQRFAVVGCKSNYLDGIRKSLNRIISLRPPCLMPEKPEPMIIQEPGPAPTPLEQTQKDFSGLMD